MAEFCVRLRALRLEKKIQQKEFAEVLGITPRAYQYYEAGKRFPDFHGLIRIADYLNVSLDYLVGRSDQR